MTSHNWIIFSLHIYTKAESGNFPSTFCSLIYTRAHTHCFLTKVARDGSNYYISVLWECTNPQLNLRRWVSPRTREPQNLRHWSPWFQACHPPHLRRFWYAIFHTAISSSNFQNFYLWFLKKKSDWIWRVSFNQNPRFLFGCEKSMRITNWLIYWFIVVVFFFQH